MRSHSCSGWGSSGGAAARRVPEEGGGGASREEGGQEAGGGGEEGGNEIGTISAFCSILYLFLFQETGQNSRAWLLLFQTTFYYIL